MRRNQAIVIAVCAILAIPVLLLPIHGESATAKATIAKSASGLDREPPEPIYEVTPAERPGYTWVPGCWTLNSQSKLYWSPGRWVANRDGYTWVPAGWEQRAEKWYYVKGYWEENPTDAAETEELAEETVATTAVTSDKTTTTKPVRKVTKKRAKKIDYSDQKKWPRVIHH